MYKVGNLNVQTDRWSLACEHQSVKGSSADQGRTSVVQGALSSSFCSFICQDQLLVLAVLLSCPLESGGSQLERAATGYALSPLCRQTHREALRDSANAERREKRENTWGDFVFYESQVCFILLLGGWGSINAMTFIVNMTYSIYLKDTVVEGKHWTLRWDATYYRCRLPE